MQIHHQLSINSSLLDLQLMIHTLIFYRYKGPHQSIDENSVNLQLTVVVQTSVVLRFLYLHWDNADDLTNENESGRNNRQHPLNFQS